MKKRGFTLIELLVVIAIIALLLSILTPALSKAKDHAKKILCSSNLKSLSVAAIMYADKNDGRTPSSTNTWSNNGTAAIGWTGKTFGLPLDKQIANLENCQLWPYIESAEAWRCPTEPDKDQLTTYSMSGQWWGAYSRPGGTVYYDPGSAGKVCEKLIDVRAPASRFMFIDQLGRNFDSYFAIWYSQPQWFNIPNFKHSGGTVNGFADGHIEPYKLNKETVNIAERAYEEGANDPKSKYGMPQSPMPDSDDLKYFQGAVWGELGW